MIRFTGYGVIAENRVLVIYPEFCVHPVAKTMRWI